MSNDLFSFASLTDDDWRGHYLCEACQDLMTDDVLPAAHSPTGAEMALCPPCQVRLQKTAVVQRSA